MPATAKKRETLVLLDTHAIIHRAYHALPDLATPSGEPIGAVYGLAAMLMKLAKDLAPDHIVAAYDLPGPTHRHEVYKEYKAKRPKADDALVEQFKRSRDILEAFGIPIYEAPGFEADDVIGTIAVKTKKDFDVIIASGDMDTLQLVDDARVRVFTLKKGINDTILYDETAVRERFGFTPALIPDYKGLRGDPSDNIIGVPGIGEKTATSLIASCGSIEEIYRTLKKSPEKLKEKAGLTDRLMNILSEHEEEAEFSKVLATIRTDAPIEFIEPKETFIERLDVKRASELFTKLGFRSLVPRLRELAGMSREEHAEPKETLPVTEDSSPIADEAKVMLWLTNSELTNPSTEDVVNNTDSENIAEAHAKLVEKIRKENLEEVWERIEKPLIPVVHAMNTRGVAIDRAHLEGLSKEYHAALDAIAAKIYAFAGEEFNVSSPKQLGEILFTKLGIGIAGKRQKKTATGQLSTKESELLKLKGEHPIVDEILRYRELSKLLGTYIDAIPPLLDAESRLHTTFCQSGAATGRFSSHDPGVQNIPIKTELGRRIRNAFVAGRGKRLVTFDYSQIELRLAAILSGDEKMIAIFKGGEDVHAAVAAELFRLPPEQITKEMRRRAKVINFGILYGMGVNALRENLGGERAEAQEYLNGYFNTFTGLAAYIAKTKATATRLGYTTTLFGRKRYFPGLRSQLPFVRAQAERMAINAPMQGTQADIIKIAMVRIHDLIRKEFEGDAHIVLQIHDELMFEVTTGRVEDFAPKAKHIMESVLSAEQARGVPITVLGEEGQNWGEMSTL